MARRSHISQRVDSLWPQAIAVVLDEGIKWLILIVFSRIFRWAMAEPQLPSFEPEDEKGWHLVFRQTSPFVWPKGKLDLCKFDHLSDNFAKARTATRPQLLHVGGVLGRSAIEGHKLRISLHHLVTPPIAAHRRPSPPIAAHRRPSLQLSDLEKFRQPERASSGGDRSGGRQNWLRRGSIRLSEATKDEGEFIFQLRWPTLWRKDQTWAQTSNPVLEAEVEGFRPIKVDMKQAGRSLPLAKSPDETRSLLVGGTRQDGEVSYFAIGHRLLKRSRSSHSRSLSRSNHSTSSWGSLKSLRGVIRSTSTLNCSQPTSEGRHSEPRTPQRLGQMQPRSIRRLTLGRHAAHSGSEWGDSSRPSSGSTATRPSSGRSSAAPYQSGLKPAVRRSP